MKRIWSLILAIALCISLMPGQALAEEAAQTAELQDPIAITEEEKETPAEEPPARTPEETPEQGPKETPAEELEEESAEESEKESEKESGEEPVEEPVEPPAEEPEPEMPAPAGENGEYTLSVTEEPEDTLLLEGAAFFYVSAAVYRGDALTGEIPAYQWQMLEGDSWTDLPEQTAQVLVLESLTEEAVGKTYRCHIRWGELETLSQSAAITGLAPTEEDTEENTVTFINPLYEDVLTEEDLPQASGVDLYASPARYTSSEAFSQGMKEALLARQDSFSAVLVVPGTDVPVGDVFMRSLYFDAVAHTGRPKEGDYLRFEFGGFSGKYSWDGSARTFTCIYNFLYYTTAKQERELDTKVGSILSQLELTDKTPEEKVAAIYGYLCSHVTYDYANLNDKEYTLKYTAYAALCQGTAVCQGYATAFYRLCLESGVDAREVSSSSMNHAWNIVGLGSFYFYVDATWDANHQDAYLYYLKGSTEWQKSHDLGDEFKKSDFAESYPVPQENYDEINKPYLLREDGTLVVLLPEGRTAIPDYGASKKGEAGYLTNAAWRKVADQVYRIEFPEGLTYIGSQAFRGLHNLEELTIPNTVTEIGRGAFGDCTGLKKLTLSGTLTLNQEAFVGTQGIEELTIPAEQDGAALTDCLNRLNALTLTGDSMSGYTRKNPAPWAGTDVAAVTLGDRLQKIGNFAFLNCKEIKTLALPKALRYIGISAFEGCTGLEELVLPKNMLRLYSDALRGCTNLKKLTFTGEKLPAMDQSALSGTRLTGIYPCTWETTPKGGFGGSVTWKADHHPEAVAGQAVTETEEGTLAHWKCSLCGRLYREETCDTELTAEEVVLYRDSYALRYEGMEDGVNPNPDTYPRAEGLKLENAQRTGYLFGGWFTDEARSRKITSIPAGTHGDLTLYPKWTAISYTLAFNAGSGSGSASKKSLKYDVDVILPKTGFQRTGYILSGWNTAKDGSGKGYAPGEPARNLTEKNKAAVTLYAQWEPITYTLVLDPKDGVTEPNSVTLKYGDSHTLPIDAGSRLGYHISTWNTRADGKGKSYTAGKPIKNLTSKDGAAITLYGRWTVNSYTVVFHSNGTTAKDRRQTFTYGKTAALSANGFGRTGYVFSGWSEAPEGEAVYGNKQRVTSLTAEQGGIVDLYAQWTPISYKVSFKANGASGTMDTVTYTYDRPQELSEMTFDRPGFTFLGWSTSTSGKVLYQDSQEVKNLTATQGRTVTLYARWRAHSYEIRFYGGKGATGTTRAMTKLSCGKTYTLNANGFQKRGYDFAGWQDADGKTYRNRAKGSNFTLEDGGVVELIAQWTPHPYTVAYKNCIAYDGNENPTRYDVESPVTFADAARPGTEFLGWYLDSRCTKPITSTEGYAQNLTLYAKWGKSPAYAIRFVGGEGTTGKMTNMTGLSCGRVYTLKANAYKRMGYSFAGWSLTPDGSVAYANQAKFGNLWQEGGEPLTLYAVWRLNTYKITYQKLIAEDENPNPGTYTVEGTVTLEAPTRPGCEFLGWYLDSSYKKPIREITAGSRAANLTLYAKWGSSGRGYKYTIAFDGNGATSGRMSPLTSRYNGTRYTLTANAYKRTGHTFLGWSLDKNAQAPMWKNKASVGNLATENGQTVTLYAVWK